MSDLFNPMLEPKIEKEYTSDFIKANLGDEQYTDEPIPEFKPTKPPVEPSSEPEQPKVEREPVVEQYKEMSAAEKRTNAEATADGILHQYCEYVPKPFIHLSSFNMKKMEKMYRQGEIDLKMPVPNTGLNVGQYAATYNKEVQQIFEVQPETKEAIREPLVEVLMEQGMVLTPTQRLLMAVGGHIVSMGIQTAQLYRSKKEDMEMFREAYINISEKRRSVNDINPNMPENYMQQSGGNNTPPPPPPPPPQTETKPAETTTEEEAIVPPTMGNIMVEEEEETIDLKSFLHSDSDHIDNDDTIIVEEELPEND